MATDTRYDLSATGTGSLMDALEELTRRAPGAQVLPPVEDADRWVIEDVASVSATPITPSQPSPSMPRRPGRPDLEVHAAPIDASDDAQVVARADEPRVPSLIDRIHQMPRFAAAGDTAHPTGDHWIAPGDRQLMGRPPV